MKNQLQLDPMSRYYRVCPYCNEPFMAGHMLQKYCPEKYGTVNYCKNRDKTVKKCQSLILGGPAGECNEVLIEDVPKPVKPLIEGDALMNTGPILEPEKPATDEPKIDEVLTADTSTKLKEGAKEILRPDNLEVPLPSTHAPGIVKPEKVVVPDASNSFLDEFWEGLDLYF